MAQLPSATLTPDYTTTDVNGVEQPVEKWQPRPVDAAWNAIVDRPIPFGLRGSTMELDVGLFDANESLRLGRVDGAPHMSIVGKGREQSMVRAKRDLGPDVYLVGGGRKLKGAKWHAAHIGVSGPVARTPALGVAPCQMNGIQAPGGESVLSHIMASYLNFGIVISSDHDYMEFIKAINCWAGLAFGLDERQEASHSIYVANLTENRRCGVYVRRSNVAGGMEAHSLHIGMEPIGIEGEQFIGAPTPPYEDNPMVLGGVKFSNLMIESPGNVGLVYAPGRNVLGNDFGVLDVVGAYDNSARVDSRSLPDLDTGIAGVIHAFTVCKFFDGNALGSTSWLTTAPPGLSPYIICDGAVNNTLAAPNIAAALKDNKPIFGPSDAKRAAAAQPGALGLVYEMGFTDTAKGHFGRLTKASVTVKRNQLVQLGPQGRGVVPHQGTGARVYGTMGQAGVQGDFLVCWSRKPYVAPTTVLAGADPSGIQGGVPVKPCTAGTGGVVACSAGDPDRIGDAMASVSNKGEVLITYV